ncbi:MAG: CHAT domain-containing protein [Thiothrix sp.]
MRGYLSPIMISGLCLYWAAPHSAHADVDCQTTPAATTAAPHTDGYAASLSAWGSYYSQCEFNYAKAESAFKQSIENSPADDAKAFAIINLAKFYMDWSQHPDQAEMRLKDAADMLPDRHPRYFEPLTHLGDFYYQSGDLDKAIEKYQQALQHVSISQHPDQHRALILNNLANAYFQQRDYAQHEKLLQESAALIQQTYTTNSTEYATNRYNLARNYQARQQYAKAKRLYAASLSYYQELPPSPLRQKALARIKTQLASIALRENDYSAATKLLAQAAPTYHQQTPANVATGTLLASQEEQDDLRHFARLQLQLHTQVPAGKQPQGLEEAFWAIQQLHGLQRMQSLQQAALRLSASGDPTQSAQLRQLWQWRQTQTQLEQQYATLIVANPAQATRISQKLTEIRQAIAEQDQALLASFPAYRQLANPAPLTLESLQPLLRDGEALMAWVIEPNPDTLGSAAYLFVARADKPAKLHRLTSHFPAQTITDLLKPMRQVSDANPKPASFSLDWAHQLYRELFAAADLEGIRHIIAVTDDELLRLPLHLLVKTAPHHPQDYRDADWLMDTYTFAYLPSIAALANLRGQLPALPKPDPRRPFLGMGAPGNDLPGAADELAYQCQRLQGEPAFVFNGSEASETRLKQLDQSGELRRFRTISFASHANIPNGVNGQEASLVLGASATDDGQLTASEIASLRLNADWVLLSACSTGRLTGLEDGLSSLVKAFFSSGTRSVLAANWDIDSAQTRRLMEALFDHLPTQHRAQALQAAMRSMLQDETHSHPFYWAGFSLYGEGN